MSRFVHRREERENITAHPCQILRLWPYSPPHMAMSEAPKVKTSTKAEIVDYLKQSGVMGALAKAIAC